MKYCFCKIIGKTITVTPADKARDAPIPVLVSHGPKRRMSFKRQLSRRKQRVLTHLT